MQCEERVYNITKPVSAVGSHGVWCEENVCSIGNVTLTV